ncbi:hypothetical protein J1605_020164 [Eschrichtius robustus]|uniref:Uncharacterized protein n=1 Tax=Eschrichtius robustus TaxID=9764 RepID=A0AB34HMR2_ESCRO|nr:hypothetical protein J1605_020164 [Eschrichtius robustus]
MIIVLLTEHCQHGTLSESDWLPCESDSNALHSGQQERANAEYAPLRKSRRETSVAPLPFWESEVKWGTVPSTLIERKKQDKGTFTNV